MVCEEPGGVSDSLRRHELFDRSPRHHRAGAWEVDQTIDDDVGDVDALWRELLGECLSKPSLST